MKSRRRPLLLAAIVTWLALAGVGGWQWHEQRLAARRARAVLAQKSQERDWFARLAPAPSAENVETIAADLAATEKTIVALRASLAGTARQPLDAAPPGRPLDAYFDLAGYVERMRALAARAQVALKPDERFGFAAHAHEGPGEPLVPAVHRQRVVLQWLVESLLESRPRALLAVQRQQPLTAPQRAGREAASVIDGPDYFAPDPRLSLRVPGLVEGEAFRLEFTGQTAALRAFLAAVSSFKLLVVVRSIEVEPLAEAAEAGPNPSAGLPVVPGAAPAPVPIIRQTLSKFAVTLECVEVLPEPAPAPTT